jgi:hypothetical protein
MTRGTIWLASSLLAAALTAPAARARADVELPRENPWAKVAQQIGLTEVSISYITPAVRGRKLWGSVVPYGQTWWIGSSSPPTKITFSKDVVFGDRAVPAGTYFMLAVPTKSSWTIVLNKNLDEPGNYRPELDVARVHASVKSAPRRERLTFLFSDVTEDKASLDIEWEKMHVSVPLRTQTEQQVFTAISGLDKTWRSYQNAAVFMLRTKKDYDAGLRYIDQSLALKDDWYSLWVKAALLASKNQFREARELGERAYERAPRTSETAALERELARHIKEWRKHEPQS